ncbi:MAG: hypothetical protein HOK97_19655 [Deltaproteobacteria bacterium]|jgi:hypothetical protein|nr:hypothetical protein [Deltaproteobacteria bacterium]
MKLIYVLFFFVLTACGHAQPTEVEMTPNQETKYEVPKGKKVLAVLGCVGECKSPLDVVLNCTGPSHLCLGSKDFDPVAYSIDQNKRQMKSLADNPNMRPLGEHFPVATIDGCDDLPEWDQEKVLSQRIVESMQEMVNDTKRDCSWSRRFLQCGGALRVVKAYNNEVMREVKKVKEDYRACTPANM